MRRSVQPNCPRAMTCCFFVSLKMLAMPAEGPRSLAPRQRLERLLPMAVFQVSMYGQFWVSTEAKGSRRTRAAAYGQAVHVEHHHRRASERSCGAAGGHTADAPGPVRGQRSLYRT